MWPYENDSSFYAKLRELPFPEIMASKDKSYYVLTDTDAPAPGLTDDPSLQPPTPLPIAITPANDNVAQCFLRITDDVAAYAECGQLASCLLRVRLTQCTERDELSFSLNGCALPMQAPVLRRVNAMYRMVMPRYRVFGQWFIFQFAHCPQHWPMQGENRITVRCLRRDSAVAIATELGLRDVELDIQYLRGQSWHRGEDIAALGPSLLQDSRPRL